MPKRCRICEGAHGRDECPEPLRVPSTQPKPGESEAAYHKRLRRNAYMAAWMRENPHIKRKRAATLRKARKTPGDERARNEKARTLRLRSSRKELLVSLKSKPCADCGRSYPPYVMQFDHRDPRQKTKRFRSPGAMAARASMEAFLVEIAKCDVVCANCHAERTFGHRAQARIEHA